MPKYRTLTLDEVKSLEKEFVDFLVVNGIPAEDWQKIKSNDPEQAEGIIDSFSDVVFEKILRNTKYLLKHGKSQVATLSCLTDRFHMIAIKYTNSEKKTIEEVFSSQKSYENTRELEIWKLMNEGFEISDGKEYLSLIDHLKDK